MTPIIISARFDSPDAATNPVIRMQRAENLLVQVNWSDRDGLVDITGAAVQGLAVDDDYNETQLFSYIENGRQFIRAAPEALLPRRYTLTARIELNGFFSEEQVRMVVSRSYGALVAAPIVSGSLPDVTYAGGSGANSIQTVSAAQVISGATGWSVTGTGATVDASGVVSLSTAAVLTAEEITVTGSNGTGSESVSFTVTVTPSAPVILTHGAITLEDLGTAVRATFTPVTASGVPAPDLALTATVDTAPLTVVNNVVDIPKAATDQLIEATTAVTNSETTVTSNLLTALVAAYDVPAAMAGPEHEVLSATAIRWARPAAPANGGNEISSYRFYYTVGGVAQPALLDVGASVDVIDLDPGDVVVGEFRAVNGAGEADAGATATAQTWQLPDTMDALEITGRVASVDIAATAPANLNGRPLNTNGYRYEIVTSGGTVTVNRPDTSAFTATGIPVSTGVYATVHARTDAGAGLPSPNSNAVIVTALGASTVTFADPAGDGSNLHFAVANDVFDVQSVTGTIGADVPIIVTASDDGQVVARVIDSADAVIHGPVVLGAGTGAEAVYTLAGVPLHPTGDDLTLQVLESETWKSCPRTFRTGYTVVEVGQSESQYKYNNGPTGLTPTLTGNGSVRVFTLSGLLYDTNVGGTTNESVKILCESHNAIDPNAHWKLVFHGKAGTGQPNMIDGTRPWVDEEAARDEAFAHELQAGILPRPGICASEWWHNTTGMELDFAIRLSPFYTGRFIDGTPLPPSGGTAVGTSASTVYPPGRTLNDLYDLNGQGRVCFIDHRELQTGALNRTANESNAGGQLQRASLANLLTNGKDDQFTPTFVNTIMSYQNDDADDSYVHPAPTTPNGYGRFAQLNAISYAHHLGLTGVPQPEFQITAADASTLRLASSTGTAITTPRTVAGTALPTGKARYTQVQGLEIDGTPAESAVITPGGDVLITNVNEAYGYTYTGSTEIAFAVGTPGYLQMPDDHDAQLWRDYPMAVNPAATAVGLEGIDMRARTRLVASDVAGVDPATGWSNIGAADPRWFSNTGIAAASEVSFMLDFRCNPFGNSGILFAIGNAGFSVQRGTQRNIEVRLNSGGGTVAFSAIPTTYAGSNFFLARDTRQVLCATARISTTGWECHVWHNGRLLYSASDTIAIAPADAVFRDSAARGWQIGAIFNGGSRSTDEIYGFKVAKSSDGSAFIDPLGADPTFDPGFWDTVVFGDAATINALPIMNDAGTLSILRGEAVVDI